MGSFERLSQGDKDCQGGQHLSHGEGLLSAMGRLRWGSRDPPCHITEKARRLEENALLYVGLSRARVHLAVVASAGTIERLGLRPARKQ